MNGVRRENSALRRRRELRYKAVSLILTGVFVVLFYALICACVGDRSLYGKTSINGIDVGGMKIDEAAGLVGRQLEKDYGAAEIKVSLDDRVYTLKVSEILEYSAESPVGDIQHRTHRFWRRGYGLLESLIVQKDYEVYPDVKDGSLIDRLISESGLMDVRLSDDTGYTVENGKLIVTKGSGSYAVDSEKLRLALEECIGRGDYDGTISCPVKSVDVDIDSIYNELHKEPQNPTLDAENGYEIVEAVDGVDFDVDMAKQKLAQAENGDKVEIDLIYTKADMTTEEYRELLFRDEVSSYSTQVDGSENRKTNVGIAARSCDGIILMPGEAFSYNGVVGDTTEEKGYLPAPAYANGESVLDYGGGVCQVSSTIYMACLYANLEINERHSHPFAASYVPVGLDATVAWESCDLIFTNNTEYPIKLSVTYDGYSTGCTIWGTVTDSFSVELYTEVTATEPYETKYELDKTLGEDDSELETTGIEGMTVQSYRRVYDGDGNVISDTPEAVSEYIKRDEVYRVGRLPEDKTEEPDDGEKSSESSTEKSSENSSENSSESSSESSTDGNADEDGQ